MSSYWIAIIIGILAYQWLRNDTAEEDPQYAKGALIFRVRIKQRRFWLFSVLGAALILLFGLTLASDDIVVWFAAVILLVGIISRPRDIHVTDEAISKVWALGLFRKSVPWHRVTHAIEYPSDCSVWVIVGDRPQFVHGRFHSARDQFLRELRKHTKVLSAARAEV